MPKTSKKQQQIIEKEKETISQWQERKKTFEKRVGGLKRMRGGLWKDLSNKLKRKGHPLFSSTHSSFLSSGISETVPRILGYRDRFYESFFEALIFLKYAQWKCVWQQHCNVCIKAWKPYNLAGFEPGIFCSVGERDDFYDMPAGRFYKTFRINFHSKILDKLPPTKQQI
jgi:hypothetical protein